MVLAQGISFKKEKEDSWNCQGGGIELFFFAWFIFCLYITGERERQEASARSVRRSSKVRLFWTLGWNLLNYSGPTFANIEIYTYC